MNGKNALILRYIFERKDDIDAAYTGESNKFLII